MKVSICENCGKIITTAPQICKTCGTTFCATCGKLGGTTCDVCGAQKDR